MFFSLLFLVGFFLIVLGFGGIAWGSKPRAGFACIAMGTCVTMGAHLLMRG